MDISLSGAGWRIMGLTPTEWVWRKVGDADIDLDAMMPAPPPWHPATVPGDVQSDLMDAGEMPVFWRDLRSRECEWTSQRDWVYHLRFDVEPEAAGRQAALCFDAVDHHCHVYLNGRHLGDHVGAYTPFEFDVTGIVQPGQANSLVVVVEHAPAEPEVQGQIGWTSRIRQWKPRFAYSWDWCTRLIPLGIIGDVRLVLSDRARIRDVWARPILRPTLDVCDLHIAAAVDALDGAAAGLAYEVADAGGTVVATGALDAAGAAVVQIDRPALWNPNGGGGRPMYTLTVRATVAGECVGQRTVRFGVRRVVALANDGAPADALPYVLEVNGVRTFIRGWNWAPIDQLYGRSHEQQYRHAIRMAHDAHCNLLRVWGGGLLERELFYDLCDEAGIMVWQEFFQSSSGIDNEPASDREFVEYARSQARQVVPLRRNHPSLVAWCGGNELFGADNIPLTTAHPVIGALEQVVRELDPDRMFLPNSPSGPTFAAIVENIGNMHDVHGHWLYQGDRTHYDFFNRLDPLLHSEFGVEGAANIETLRRFVSPERLWPPDRTNPVWIHHGCWWINRPVVEDLFGPLEDIDTFVRASQWLQAEGLRYAVEASRRRKWRTSGCMPWQFNEPWPNTSCTNALDYFGRPKPVFWTMRNAYAPIAVSARYDRLQWNPGDRLDAQVWLNAAVALPGPCEVRWRIFEAVTGTLVASGGAPVPETSGEPAALHICDATAALGDRPALWALTLEVCPCGAGGGEPVACGEYLFSSHSGAPFAAALRIPQSSRIRTHAAPGGFVVEADGPLVNLAIVTGEDHAGPYHGCGYRMYVAPGESITVPVDGAGTVRLSAWNAPAIDITVP